MSLRRRNVLAAVAAVAALGMAGAASTAAVLGSWWQQAPDAPLRHLSVDEVAVLDAIAEAIFPAGGEPALSGREAKVGRYLDALLAGMVPTQRDLFRFALHGLNTLAYAQAGATLPELGPEGVGALLRRWLVSSDTNLRGIAQSLHVFIGMAYLAHPEVSPAIAAQFGCGFGSEPEGFGHAG
jgi:hypothetical protein